MKKISILLLATLLLFSLSACNLPNHEKAKNWEIIEVNSWMNTEVKTGDIIDLETKETEQEKQERYKKEKEILLSTAKEYFWTGYSFLWTGVAQRVWKVVPWNICRNYKNSKLGIKRNLNKYWTGCKVLEVIQLDGNQEVIFWVRMVKTSDKIKENKYNDFKDFPPLSGYVDIIGYYTLDKKKHPLVKSPPIKVYSGTSFPFGKYKYKPSKEYKKELYNEARASDEDGENNKYYLVMGGKIFRDPIIEESAFPNLNVHNHNDIRYSTVSWRKGDECFNDWIYTTFPKHVSFFDIK